jgi:phage-related protein/predicted XRE-type DNA-binding protein
MTAKPPDIPVLKALRFFGDSQQTLAALDAELMRRRAAFELRQLQWGVRGGFAPMPVFMAATGEQAFELHVGRCVAYVAEGEEAVFVLHAFLKQGQRLHREDLTVAEGRYRRVRELAADAGFCRRSSGNVFFDLGYPKSEAAALERRADLVARLRLLARRRGWSPEQMAGWLGMARSSADDLLRGRWSEFSLSRLQELAARDKGQ